LGKENVSSRNLQELCYDRFATADLVGKLANISGDLSNNKICNTGIFKQLVGKDSITVQKKYLQAQTVEIYAKLFFATNQPPEPKSDVSLAYFRRWNLITFPHIFMGEKKDSFKINKLTTEEELEGLAILLVKALQELIKTGGFPETQTVEEIKNEYMRKANPIQSFADDSIIEKEGGFVKTDELHKIYVDYCKKHNYSPEGKNKFRQAFEKQGYLYDRKASRRGFADIEINTQKTKETTLKDFEFAKIARICPVPYRKKLELKNIKKYTGDNRSKNGNFGTNESEQTSNNKCPNCDSALPKDESKIIFYKDERYHTHCHAKISESLPKKWYVEDEQ
jgi:phage/plasmid-associated DNA primase